MPNLDDLWDEMSRGHIYECSLRDPVWHLDGLQTEGKVYIDPRTSILETLIHELMHRRHPRMREMAVTREARLLLGKMDEATKRKWWNAYRRVRKLRRPINVDLEE